MQVPPRGLYKEVYSDLEAEELMLDSFLQNCLIEAKLAVPEVGVYRRISTKDFLR